jgi:ubiquinone biosynthesis protein UbiJ
MLAKPLTAALNHLLGKAAWARRRLAVHAGRHILVTIGAFSLRLTVTSYGFLAESAGADGLAPDLTLTLPVSALPLAVTEPRALTGSAHIAGHAELAETVSLLLRELRWDAEDDLAPLLGDVAAVRLVRGARLLRAEVADAAKRFQQSLSASLTDDQSAAVPRHVGDARADEIAELDAALRSLGNRVARLEVGRTQG